MEHAGGPRWCAGASHRRCSTNGPQASPWRRFMPDQLTAEHSDAHPNPYDCFTALDVRAGLVTEVKPFDRARVPSYRLVIDFGPEIGEPRVERAGGHRLSTGGAARTPGCSAWSTCPSATSPDSSHRLWCLACRRAGGGLNLVRPDVTPGTGKQALLSMTDTYGWPSTMTAIDPHDDLDMDSDWRRFVAPENLPPAIRVHLRCRARPARRCASQRRLSRGHRGRLRRRQPVPAGGAELPGSTTSASTSSLKRPRPPATRSPTTGCCARVSGPPRCTVTPAH